MDDNDNEQPDRVEYDNETFFTNSIRVTRGSSNLVIDFKQRNTRINDNDENTNKTLVTHHRPVVMKITLAKILLKMLGNIVRKYEKEFGKIELHKKEKKRVENRVQEGSHYIG